MSSQGTPLIVAGMHRSGTSFTTARLQRRGMHLGRDLLEADTGNDHGHFESKAVMDFHIELIDELRPGYTEEYGKLSSLLAEDPGYEITDPHRDRAKELIEEIREGKVWGWKDPRTCLFLDLWLELLPDARILVLYRHPLEVHDSLCRRGGDPEMWLDFDEARSVPAYNVYNEALLKSLEKSDQKQLVLNAPGSFTDREKMDRLVVENLDLSLSPIEEDNFDAASFSAIPLTQSLLDLFEKYFPRAHKNYARLEALAGISQPVPDPAEPRTKEVEKAVTALVGFLDTLPTAPDASTLLRLMLQAANAGGPRPFSETLAKMRLIAEERFGWLRSTKKAMREEGELRDYLEGEVKITHKTIEDLHGTIADLHRVINETQDWARAEQLRADQGGGKGPLIESHLFENEKTRADNEAHWREEAEAWAKREQERATDAEKETSRAWTECESAVEKLAKAEERLEELEELIIIRRTQIEMKEEARSLRDERAQLEDHSYRLRVELEQVRKNPAYRLLNWLGFFRRKDADR